MSTNLKAGISMVRHALKLLEALSNEDIEMLESGQASLEIKIVPKFRKKENSSEEEGQMASLRSKLETSTTRDEASSLLREAIPSKVKLQRFARTLDLTYQKDDSVDRLIEKIVEVTIGYKLRSQAVTGSTGQLL